MKNSIGIVIIIALCVIVFSCNHKSAEKIKRINFDVFSIKVPATWDKVPLSGIDSYTGGITTGKDTIEFIFGTSIEGLNDVAFLQPYETKLKLDSLGQSIPSGMMFSKHYNIDSDQGTYLAEYYFYDTIDNQLAKFQVPKMIGRGFFTVYFEDIDSAGNDLRIGCKNIDSLGQKLFYESLRTIEFKKD
jgi:hypothetical protein